MPDFCGRNRPGIYDILAGYSADVNHFPDTFNNRNGTLVMNTNVNLAAARVQKARFYSKIGSRQVSWALSAAGLAAFVGGLILLFFNSSIGYLVLTLAILVLMIKTWQAGELKSLDKEITGQNVEDLLDSRILAKLKSADPSAFDIWVATKDTTERWFFESRYLLHHSIFEELLNKNSGSATAVWQEASKLREKYQTTGWSAAIIIVALLRTIPDIEEGLKRIKIELRDIELGIDWWLSIDRKTQLAHQKKYFGGLARDWAYGYTPTLSYLGRNISEDIQYGGFFTDTKMHSQLVEQMIKSMAGGAQAVTLIGENGVGKTTSVHAFAERILQDGTLPENIRYHQVVTLDAPSLVAQAGRPGELEELVIKMLAEAQKAKNMILFFDDAQAFFGDGAGSVDLGNVLMPALDAGTPKLIFAMTPKQWQNIAADNSNLSSKFQPLQVNPANEEETLDVLRDEILFLEYQKKALYTYQAFHEAYKLAKRYVDNLAMPGAALTVLKTAASSSEDGLVTAEVIKASVESTYGVKLQQATREETDVLLHMEDELHKYVINQKQAVSVIANALRRSRSGVGNPERPVGTFLFLGPTGVGKTELSKALAKVYFGDEKSMIRVDMNQFVSPDDVNRLITPMLGEQLGFLGQVRKQPFSVILLDEIEKAHKNVVNLLLQMLDEGVMRDNDNKPVSFKDSIIIATSNAGADEIRRMIDEGKDIAKLQENLVNTVIEKGIFAPELINRFDEVVVFRPLNQDELIQVIDLIIKDMNKTLDAQKVRVELTQVAKKWLVDKGYDAKLGARPMRRVVQRYVENILAKKLLEQTAGSGSKIELDVKDFEEMKED